MLGQEELKKHAAEIEPMTSKLEGVYSTAVLHLQQVARVTPIRLEDDLPSHRKPIIIIDSSSSCTDDNLTSFLQEASSSHLHRRRCFCHMRRLIKFSILKKKIIGSPWRCNRVFLFKEKKTSSNGESWKCHLLNQSRNEFLEKLLIDNFFSTHNRHL